MCEALEIPDVPNRPQFLDNRLRIQNAEELDDELQAAIEQFDYEEIMRRFEAIGATAAPCYNVAEIFEDEHYKARENIVPIAFDGGTWGRTDRRRGTIRSWTRRPPRLAREIQAAAPELDEQEMQKIVWWLKQLRDELKEEGIDAQVIPWIEDKEN
mgnify:CR=1 FL=1